MFSRQRRCGITEGPTQQFAGICICSRSQCEMPVFMDCAVSGGISRSPTGKNICHPKRRSAPCRLFGTRWQRLIKIDTLLRDCGTPSDIDVLINRLSDFRCRLRARKLFSEKKEKSNQCEEMGKHRRN